MSTQDTATDDATRQNQNRNAKEPGRGPWAWRDYLPTDELELDMLKLLAGRALPEGINLTRFFGWVEAEMAGEASPIKGNRTLTKYRKLLFELSGELDAHLQGGGH